MNMAKRAFAELQKGDVVNLGIGIPTLVADLIRPEHGIILHTENGMLGVGPSPADGGGALHFDGECSKIPVTAHSGSSYVEAPTVLPRSVVDTLMSIMGSLEVDENV